MSICYLGPTDAISPFGTGGAENLIRRRKEKRGSEKYYFLTDDLEFRLILPDGTFKKSHSSTLRFLIFLYQYRNIVTFSPVALSYRLRMLLNIFHFLRIVKIERIIFNYPGNRWKLKLYITEALLFSNKIYYLSSRQYRFLNRTRRFLPLISCKTFVKEQINVPSSFCCKYAEKKGFVVSFIGRLDGNKGIEEVLEIAELLKEQKNITMNICYLSNYRGRTESFVSRLDQLNQYENLNIIPSMKHENEIFKNEVKVSDLLKATHVFLQPYKFLSSAIEAPLLLYEAHKAGCVIFTRDVDGIHEHLIGQFEFFSGDASQYAKSAVDLIKKLRRDQLD
jgi:glycosyltransferase involved in cell wall biosynthesis